MVNANVLDRSVMYKSTSDSVSAGEAARHVVGVLYDPSARPQTEFLCKPIRRIMEEKSIKRNPGGGLVGGAMIEKISLRRSH